MKKAELGNRMKKYEDCYRNFLIPRSSIIIRIDGKAFHTFTKKAEKPFDHAIMTGMTNSAEHLFRNMQGCKMAYIQSDEASFWLTDFDNLHSEGWFNYNHSKIVSLSASIFTAAFNNNDFIKKLNIEHLAFFDSRAFNVPNEEIANYFLWRAKDWERNSLQMYCRTFFSHKELNNKSRYDMYDMLNKIGKDWRLDLSPREKYGTFLLKTDNRIIATAGTRPNFYEINNIVESLMPKYINKEEHATQTHA